MGRIVLVGWRVVGRGRAVRSKGLEGGRAVRSKRLEVDSDVLILGLGTKAACGEMM